jgi:hypothetical protein
MSRRGKGEESTDYGVHALQSGNKAGKGGVVDYSHIRPEAGERGLWATGKDDDGVGCLKEVEEYLVADGAGAGDGDYNHWV